MNKESITLNTQEQKRAMVLNRIQAGQLSVREAASVLGISERHCRRILAGYRKEGPAILAHGNRGRQPVSTIGEEVRKQVIVLATTTYAGTNQQHLRDLLEERNGIKLSRSSVHRSLVQAGLLQEPSRKKPQHRRRRERKSQAGMLVQIEASPHDLLEGRGPRLHLLGAIDDATGQLVAAVFRLQEDAAGYFELLWQLVKRHGRPLALYHDRHGIFQQTTRANEKDSLEEQLAGKQEPTQFGRLLAELEITSIAARSPQAKGRVERLFGTLQGRLPIELGLAGACTLEQASAVLQQYLPRFSAQFAVSAAQEGSVYRPLPAQLKAQEVFCFKYERSVAADNTISLGPHRLQLLAGKARRSYARARVIVHEHLDGSLAVFLGQECLASQPAPPETPLLRARQKRARVAALQEQAQVPAPEPALAAPLPASPTPEGVGEAQQEAARAVAVTATASGSTSHKPAANHCWRKPFLGKGRTKSLDT